MPMTINFYNEKKRINSTKKPSGGVGTIAELKEGCDLYNPVFIVRGNYLSYTMMGYEGFYYYITGQKWVNGNWEVSGTIDPLATWRDDIKDHSCVIVRSSADKDGAVVDTSYPIKSTSTFETTPISLYGGGCYIVPISSVYGLQYVVCSDRSAVNALIAKITDKNSYGTPLSHLADWLAFKPMDYVGRVFYIPVSVSVTSNNLAVGNFIVEDYTVSVLAQTTYSANVNVTFNPHPDAEEEGAYMNGAPYTERFLIIPPFGIIPINTALISNTNVLQIRLYVDCENGAGTVKIVGGNANVIAVRSADLSVDIPVTGVNYSVSPESLISIATNTIVGNIGGVVGGVVSAVSSPDVVTAGSKGNKAMYSINCTMQTIYHNVTERDNDNRGRPLMKVKTVSDLSGFMICENGNVNTKAPEPYKSRIKSFLEGGFYYE